MTEVPEHLLKRSQARRAALGLGGGDDSAPAAADAAPSASTEVSTTDAAPVAAAAAVERPAPEPEFVPAYVEASLSRKRIPVWAMPVLAFLPVWAVVYAQSLSPAPTTEVSQLAAGAAVFAPCSGCHGADGSGGTGRKLKDGEVLKTFPNIADQLQFIRLGTAAFEGEVYGDPNREGGAHKGLSYNGKPMPTFSSLTDAQLLEVARHERETLSGEEGDFEVDAEGNRLWPNGEPMLDASGTLVWDDGEPMFDADGNLTKDVDPSSPPSAG